MINCRWGVNQLGIFAWRENVRNPDVAARAENIATDVLFGLSVYGEKGGRRRGGSDWCAGQEAAREWWIETKRRLRNTRWRSRSGERKKGHRDGSSPAETTSITDSVYDIPGSESDHYEANDAEDGRSPSAQTAGSSKANPPATYTFPPPYIRLQFLLLPFLPDLPGAAMLRDLPCPSRNLTGPGSPEAPSENITLSDERWRKMKGSVDIDDHQVIKDYCPEFFNTKRPNRARVLKFVKLVDEHPSAAFRQRGEGQGWEKFGCARKRSTMNPQNASAPSGKVRQTEAARVELCIRELRGNGKGAAATASHYCDSLSTLTKVLKRVMTDPSIKSRHRKNKSRQMTMMMTPVKAQDDSAVAPRRAPQGTASMSR
ncbi:hypothetical protein ALC56_11882 [Trachymyrmex septentrionalis]|uniref:Uncharacterized protein n=1 Tax=Trachymyrmex septentrionalis TaxID=34720 RepID=A0A195F0C5_9HYME|nr:hypothetical protein ALC56_11882 [Trachymyrmex septentrionalis]